MNETNNNKGLESKEYDDKKTQELIDLVASIKTFGDLREENFLQKVDELAKQGADINTPLKTTLPLLHLAANGGEDIELAKILVQHGVDINRKDNISRTPLMLAAKISNHQDFINLLIENGADLNIKGMDSYVMEVNSYKAALDQPINTEVESYTALMWACEKGILENAKALVEAGADVNLRDEHGNTALMIAACWGHFDVFRYLFDIQGKKALEEVNAYGNNALKLAINDNHRSIADFIRSNIT